MTYFAYSTHKTLDAAELALEDYFADGIICEAERPHIKRIGKRWCVMFPAGY